MSCVTPYRWPQSIPTVYARKGRDNRSLIVLYRTLTPHKQRANLKGVRRILLSFDKYNDPAVVIDSDIDSSVIDWKSRGEEGYIYLSLGKWKYPLTFDAVGQCAELIIFDPAYSDGLVWGTLRVLWLCSG